MDSPRLAAANHFSTCVLQPGTFSTNSLNFYLAQLRRPVDEVLCVWEEAARLFSGWDWLVTEHCVQDGVCGFEVERCVGGFVCGWLPSKVANTELLLTLLQTSNHVAMAAQLILN